MKKYFLFLFFIPYFGFSQTYRELFEATEPPIINGNSFSTNFSDEKTYALHQTEPIAYTDHGVSFRSNAGSIHPASRKPGNGNKIVKYFCPEDIYVLKRKSPNGE